MKVGIIGLGKMGNAIAYRLLQGGHEVVGFDLNEDALRSAQQVGVEAVDSIQDVAKKSLVIWLMVPVGEAVDSTIAKLIGGVQKEIIVIDGGNSNFEDSIKRYEHLKKEGICFLDCGTSGGLHGREFGFSLVIGGDKRAYEKIIPILKSIAAVDGFAYMGESGSGHYVKMVHNAIEYGLLQAYAEGFHLLKEGQYKNLDLEKISSVWMNGSIIRSWILQLLHQVFAEKKDFTKIIGEIAEGGTGRWAVEEAKKQGISVRVLEESLHIREWSRQTGGNFATKIVALLRNKFGGHDVKIKN